MKTQSDKKLLEIKKAKFLEEVENSAIYLGYPTPKVKFWKTCDRKHFNNERAHIHIETNTICILETEFDFMTFDDIKESASHEVTHLYDQGHYTRFQNKRIDTEASSWRPPRGTVGALPERDKEDKKKTKPNKEKVIKSRCNYYSCRKKGKTKQCSHCRNYFCEEHIKPCEAGMNPIHNTDSRLRHLDPDDENTHPCFGYNNYLKEEEKRQMDKLMIALDKMKGKTTQKSKKYDKENYKIDDEEVKEDFEKDEEDENELRKLTLARLKENKKQYNKSKTVSYDEPDEMYTPGRKANSSYNSYSGRHFSFKNFLRKYIYFRVQDEVRPHLMQFLLIFIIGIVLNYVYYQTFSLSYLFIGGVKEWFSVLIPTLNYGLGAGYDLVYLIVNGIYYTFFYYSFALIIFCMITNLDDRDTWVMAGWFALIIYLIIHFFPQIL